ncbi:Zinc finger CCCH domain-containing protein 15 [Nymphon striatum]|nr:Zinc finger CCCH domain-containing protein 15 [Nymphon striatum]
MPPKKKPEGPSKKNETKKKERLVESADVKLKVKGAGWDKTFGLKNKKGTKQQKFIANVQNQVKFGSQSGRKLELMKLQDKAKKEEKKKDVDTLNELFKPVVVQKLEKGADPKSVLCSYFKLGQCKKGDKCKFSHDLNIERKAEKRSMYVDIRDDDTMESWDEDKLRDVVNKKHAEAEENKPKTDIICRHFLDALEKSKYGWFWECPSREKCIYKHALPPGFVLKKDKQKSEKEEEISIEELVERERANLGPEQTKVTYETFMGWKRKKVKEKADKLRQDRDTKKSEFKAGKAVGISGRDMFTFRPDMATEDENGDADGEVAYDLKKLRGLDEDYENDDIVKEVSIEMFSSQIQATINGELEKLEAAGGIADSIENVPIDEDLFGEDDLDELEEDLENLELQP